MQERALQAAGASHPNFCSNSISQVVIISRISIKTAPSVHPERNLVGGVMSSAQRRQAFAFSCITLTLLEPRFKAVKHFKRPPGKCG